MSQILSWKYQFPKESFPKSAVLCQDQTAILNYLTPTSIIIFTQEIIEDKDNLLFLSLLKLSMPNTDLILLNSNLKYKIFSNSTESELPSLLDSLLVKPFIPEDKKTNITYTYNLLKNSL